MKWGISFSIHKIKTEQVGFMEVVSQPSARSDRVAKKPAITFSWSPRVSSSPPWPSSWSRSSTSPCSRGRGWARARPGGKPGTSRTPAPGWTWAIPTDPSRMMSSRVPRGQTEFGAETPRSGRRTVSSHKRTSRLGWLLLVLCCQTCQKVFKETLLSCRLEEKD